MNPIAQAVTPEVEYPDDDGRPMSDNSVQHRWIVLLFGNLAALYRDRPDVFVAGNHLIYAREGRPKVRAAPDVYVAFGRPKGDRGSYQVWREGGVFPQVIVEVLSPGNRSEEMARRLLFYHRHGAEEYYVFDPDRVTLDVHLRGPRGRFRRTPVAADFVSPRLGVRFDLSGPDMAVFHPDGRPFRTFEELAAAADADAARAAREAARADREAAENARLRDLLRAAGLDPEEAS